MIVHTPVEYSCKLINLLACIDLSGPNINCDFLKSLTTMLWAAVNDGVKRKALWFTIYQQIEE